MGGGTGGSTGTAGGGTGGSTDTAGSGKGGTSGAGGVTQSGVSSSSSGAVDAAVDGVADGGSDEADADQGDADTRALYAACRDSKDEATCSERGGTWRLDYNKTYGICVCPTGEGGRPCTASSDCLGDCTAWMDPMQGNGTWCQKYVTGYTCSAEGGKQGCWCRPESPFAVCFP